MVNAFDTDNLKEYVEGGAWEKIAQNRVIRKVLEETKQSSSSEGMLVKTQNTNLFTLLLLNL